MIKEVANLPDGMQMEVFRTIASKFLLPILEMTLNELAGVFESNRRVPLEEPGPILEKEDGKGVGIMKPTLPRHTWALQKKKLALAESDNDDDVGDKHAKDEVFEVEWPKTMKQKARTQIHRAIS